jgi:hypothetical protein
MDRRERFDDLLVAVKAMLSGFQAGLWTAMPATVVSFNAAKATVAAQPAIQAQFRAGTAQQFQNVTLPQCVDCPVITPGGGGFLATFPLAAGDEGLLVFASRCIDAWWQQGDAKQQGQPQAELRMHDLSDGFFIPACFSQPNVPANWSTTSAQLRSKDGLAYVEVAPGHAVNIVAPGGVKITGALEIDGALALQGALTAPGGGTYAGAILTSGAVEAGVGSGDHVTLQGHKHGTGAAAAGTSIPTPGF